METMLIGMYFLAALVGVFAGLFLGFNIRSFSISRAEKRRYMRHYVKKKKFEKKHENEEQLKTRNVKPERKQQKKESGILMERVPEKDSYTGFICDSSGENAVTKIQNMRHLQDQKYKSKAKK